MGKLIEMDVYVTLARQIEKEDISGQQQQLKAWTDDATLMKQQPGLISIAQRKCW